MARILVDAFSIFDFANRCPTIAVDYNFTRYSDFWHLIENLILSEKVFILEESLKLIDSDFFLKDFNESIQIIPNTDITQYKLEEYKSNIGMKERGLIYLDIARCNNLYFSPHPFRQNILGEQLVNNVDKVARIIIERFDQKISKTDNGLYAKVNIKVPPVVEHVLNFSKCKKKSIADSINEIRNNKKTILFRKFCNELDNKLSEQTPRKNISQFDSLFREIDKICNDWQKNLELGFKFKQRKLNLTKIPLLGKYFEILDIKEISYNDPIIKSATPHFLFINDLYNN